MKKLIVTILLFSFISVIPSYGMKVITNKPLDRTVPSRSSGTFNDYNSTDTTTYEATLGSSSSYGGIKGYQAVRFYQYYKPGLSRDLRPELLGTRWDYPAYTIENPGSVTVKKANHDHSKPNLKRYMREAADYYVVDTINHPDSAVESKHEDYFQ